MVLIQGDAVGFMPKGEESADYLKVSEGGGEVEGGVGEANGEGIGEANGGNGRVIGVLEKGRVRFENATEEGGIGGVNCSAEPQRGVNPGGFVSCWFGGRWGMELELLGWVAGTVFCD